jgi:hypothetical protein
MFIMAAEYGIDLKIVDPNYKLNNEDIEKDTKVIVFERKKNINIEEKNIDIEEKNIVGYFYLLNSYR